MDRGDQLEGTVDEEFHLPDSAGPKEHGGETFLLPEIGIAPVGCPAQAEKVQGIPGVLHGCFSRQEFVVLADEGDVLTDVQVRNERIVQGNDPPAGMVLQKGIPIPFQDVLMIEENQTIDRAINVSTSINMMARKTRIIP